MVLGNVGLRLSFVRIRVCGGVVGVSYYGGQSS